MLQKHQKTNEQRGRLIWEEKHNEKINIIFLLCFNSPIEIINKLYILHLSRQLTATGEKSKII